MADNVDEFLAHYGVLGMQWGKRKAKEPKQTRAQKKKAVAAERKANQQAARKAGYTPTMRIDDMSQVYLNGVRRIEKNVANGKSVAAARVQEYSRATAVGLGIGASLLALRLSPMLLRKANVGLSTLASNINAKRGAKAAADLFANNKGLTSYSTVALAFDKAKGVWA
jgi:hypothetical protein